LELAGDPEFDIASIVTDRTRLENAVEAYRRFDRREDGCVKVLLLPGEAR
jgi:threonine dehydrogenase-like Zn-dependent dehydrogenase